jgi:hypothetical protein
MSRPLRTFDDAGVHVMAERCASCIFRPGNLMHLRAGRMADLTQQTDAADTNVICRQTLDRPVGAFCAGSVERRAGQAVRMAYRLSMIVPDR